MQQGLSQVQKQIQRMSQVQIQAVNLLAMSNRDLREEIFKTVADNPALEIVSDPRRLTNKEKYSSGSASSQSLASDANQRALEAVESRGETLQQHLMSQLNLLQISRDEYDLSQKLIYNLDSNGCYGSMLAPETLIDKARPAQNAKMLARCIDRIQKMDPVGTCCRTLEESLFIHAKIAEDAPPLALFILDGHLELLNPPQPERVLKNLKDYLKQWHSKQFAPKIVLDEIELNEAAAATTIKYITSLNPRPAGEYISDTSQADFLQPDIILSITKEHGAVPTDDFENGIVTGGPDFHFRVKYSNGELPEIRIAPDYTFDAQSVKKANEFLHLLKYRQSSIILLGCAIVSEQKDFFINGPGNLKPLTRRQIAKQIGVHESTVSRMTGKKSNRRIDVMGELYPASYFFVAGPST
ncbi:MAG: hypothetical protein J6U06_04830, partial [Spirochaetaceae bacterium]|nr:hypothetical protein [Spirochaetaceae bacterium]